MPSIVNNSSCPWLVNWHMGGAHFVKFWSGNVKYGQERPLRHTLPVPNRPEPRITHNKMACFNLKRTNSFEKSVKHVMVNGLTFLCVDCFLKVSSITMLLHTRMQLKHKHIIVKNQPRFGYEVLQISVRSFLEFAMKLLFIAAVLILFNYVVPLKDRLK